MSKNPFEIYENTSRRFAVDDQKQAYVIDQMPTVPDRGRGSSLMEKRRHYSRIPEMMTVLLFAVLVVRIFFLQVVQGVSLRDTAEGNRIQRTVVKALRGVLYDSSGNLLVKNVPNFTIIVEASESPRDPNEEYTRALRDFLQQRHITPEAFDAAIRESQKNGQPIRLEDHLPYEEALRLMITVRSIPGVRVEVYYAREYTHDESMSHLLGYTAKMTAEEYVSLRDKGYFFNDTLGKTGLENYYEESLRGTDGYRNTEVDSRGNEQALVSDIPPISGDNIYLAIHQGLQNNLYNALRDVVDAQDYTGAAAVAIDPRTGSIRALVSYPSYDNTVFAQGISEEQYQQLADNEKHPLFFRAIAGEYPAGSTFKPIVAAAGLEEGIITQQSTINSTGGITINGFVYQDYRVGGYGVTNVIKGLAQSVNSFFYYVGGGDNQTTAGLGVERITSYARKFGLGQQLGIDVPGESAGFLPSKEWKEEFKNEPWYIGDTYHLSIGQGDLLVTPLQIAESVSVFANGGTLYQPHIVEKITDQSGISKEQIKPEVLATHVVSAESIAIVREGMREGVLSGGSRQLQTLPVTAAGKTGTAQYGTDEQTHAWSTAFAPFESPEIAIAVIVEGGGVGEVTAVPIVKNALLEYFGQPTGTTDSLTTQ